MATFTKSTLPGAPTIGSYQTALCIIPPANLHSRIDALRALHDKAYGRWPPHINLIYPFVTIESLPHATDLIRSKLQELGTDHQNINLRLDKSDHFSHRHSNTVFIAPSQNNDGNLKTLRDWILDMFKSNDNEQEYHPHLTIGQTPAKAAPMCDYLLEKARLLLPITWQVGELVVLVRDKAPENRNTESCMRIWGSIVLSQDVVRSTEGNDLCKREQDQAGSENVGFGTALHQPGQSLHSYGFQRTSSAMPRTTFHFSKQIAVWKPVDSSIPRSSPEQIPGSFAVSSYNVLHDPSITISSDERYPILLKAILHDHALSDILVLQEVSDDFLTFLLNDITISSRYRFATHTPTDPLPSLRNIVVLCRWNFSWEYLPVEQRHKGAVVVQLSNIGRSKSESWKPPILVGVHLSSGLSNVGVAARKSQIQAILDHLSKRYPTNPWIIAGDFNITTNPATIEEAISMKAISVETANISESLIPMLDENGLTDVWIATGGDCEDGFNSGDAGATFDPLQNALATETVRNAGSKNMRPRRYDRIFVKGGDMLEATYFNMFGLSRAIGETTSWKEERLEVKSFSGSDHYGIRAVFNVNPFGSGDIGKPPTIGNQPSNIKLYATPPALTDPLTLSKCLNNYSAFPSDSQSQHRKEVLGLLNNVLQSSAFQLSFSPTSTAQPTIILLPVGSYALETFLPTSDLDVLALSTFSASSFFSMAMRRLQNAKESGVKVLRRVDAATGTMLELEIKGVKCDLQHCCAPAILSRWQEIRSLLPSDPVFQLPIQALQKINSYRDLEYIKHVLSNSQIQELRLAHRFLHIWARERGVYSGKFGFLNGFSLTIMLFSIVRRLLTDDDNTVTASKLAYTFFNYYASFDWAVHMVHDVSFVVEKRPYRRNVREVMVVLSLHTPRVNILRASSLPVLRTFQEELNRTERMLADPLVSWESLVGGPVGAGVEEFLMAYKSYVKVDVHYWGTSVASGNGLVGWLESRCVALLVDLSRKVPSIQARIWPARFALSNYGFESGTEEGYQGCYLIGLRRVENPEKSSMSDSDRKLAQDALRTALEKFGDHIRGDEKYFDPSTSWVDVCHVKQADVGKLTLDERDWGEDIQVFHQSDVENDLVSRETGLDIIFSNEGDSEDEELPAHKPKSKSTSASKSSKANTKPISSKKLRPASDILSRLRWDPDLDSSDYVVGYIDRFLGTKEQGLETWKSEQTDEEFIPQHRIVYFRRKSNDVQV